MHCNITKHLNLPYFEEINFFAIFIHGYQSNCIHFGGIAYLNISLYFLHYLLLKYYLMLKVRFDLFKKLIIS